MGILIVFRQEVGQFSVGAHGAGHIQVGEVGHLAIGVDIIHHHEKEYHITSGDLQVLASFFVVLTFLSLLESKGGIFSIGCAGNLPASVAKKDLLILVF